MILTIASPATAQETPTMATTTAQTPCHAARTGEGYWTCDVTGGCGDCRTLAHEIDDVAQRERWDAQRRGALGTCDTDDHDAPHAFRSDCVGWWQVDA